MIVRRRDFLKQGGAFAVMPVMVASCTSGSGLSSVEYDILNTMFTRVGCTKTFKRHRQLLLQVTLSARGNPSDISHYIDVDELVSRARDEWPKIKDSTLRSFAKRNSAPVLIDGARMKLTCHELVNDEQAEQIARRSMREMRKFGSRYSYQTLSLSRIGTSFYRDEALLYSEVYCGPVCGSAHLGFLKKSGGTWQDAGVKRLWIS